jgi:antitoxin (DNA-binding transcriptional repressor) of toxin-antitoxin stability system
MKTATVRELRNHYARLLRWTDAGEEVAIRRKGRVVARLLPASAKKVGRVDWSASAALRMDKNALPCLSAAESARLLDESQGGG